MYKTTKSPRKVLVTALAVAKDVLPAHAHRFSPRKFTQHQLFAVLVLKEFCRCDYRKVAALLKDCPDLCGAIELKAVPHFTTIQKAAQRLLILPKAKSLLRSTLELARKKLLNKRLANAAVDTTGLEDRHTSHHFRKRREESQKSGKNRKKSPFPKLALLCDCLSHLTLSVRTGRGPASDQPYFKPLLDDAAAMFVIRRLLADAGFDSEEHHVYSRQQHATVAIIPPLIGRPTAKPPTAKHRRRMKLRWADYRKRYGQRWQIETVNSMYKRLLGSALRAIKRWNKCREMVLRVLTLNIMILAAAE